MLTIRRAGERGHTQVDWLDSWHTFSFGEYHDPAHMGFRTLRVINEDRVVPGAGFGTHGHRDMEIVTCVLAGALEHRDSLGNGSVIRPGEVQRMSAGTGIRHSEFNASPDERVHFLQIWILPERPGLPPGYEQRVLPPPANGGLRLIGSRDGRDGSVTIHQDVQLFAARVMPQRPVSYALAAGRHGWLQVTQGSVTVDGTTLAAGDGAACPPGTTLTLHADALAEALLFDLA